MKRGWFYLVSMVILVAALVGCAPKAVPSGPQGAGQGAKATASAGDAAWQKVVQDAQKEGKVSVYSFNLTGDVGTAVAKAFKSAYGIDMEVVTGPGAQLVERVRSERRGGQYLVDIMDGSPALVIQLKQDGSTVPAGDLPVLKETGVWRFPPVVDKDGNILWWIPTLFIPYYNSTMVKAADVPQSWKGFLDPKWKGKVAISNPDTVPTLNRMYAVLTTRGVLDKNYFSDLGKVDLKFYPTFRDDIAGTARGEVALDLSSAPMVANPLIKQGAPVRPFDIKEGVTASGAVVTEIKNAPHPNAARVYLNWLETKDGQAVVHQAISATPLRTDVPDFTPAEAKLDLTKVLVETEADIIEGARLQTERVLSKAMVK